MFSKVSLHIPPHRYRDIFLQILLVSLLVLGTSAGPANRSKRGLGLIKLGYDWATQGLTSGISEGLGTGFADLSTGGKIGAGLMVAKPLALALLGKCKLALGPQVIRA